MTCKRWKINMSIVGSRFIQKPCSSCKLLLNRITKRQWSRFPGNAIRMMQPALLSSSPPSVKLKHQPLLRHHSYSLTSWNFSGNNSISPTVCCQTVSPLSNDLYCPSSRQAGTMSTNKTLHLSFQVYYPSVQALVHHPSPQSTIQTSLHQQAFVLAALTMPPDYVIGLHHADFLFITQNLCP